MAVALRKPHLPEPPRAAKRRTRYHDGHVIHPRLARRVARLLLGTTAAAVGGCSLDYDGFSIADGTTTGSATTGAGASAGAGGNGGPGGAGAGASAGGATSAGGGGGGAAGGSSATTGGGGAAPACGDTIVDPDEDCDDGNTDVLDGCSATCTTEDRDSCMDAPFIAIADQETVVADGDITGAIDDVSSATASAECGAGVYSGGDHVFAVAPEVDGSLYVHLDASYDYHWLHVRDGCPGTTGLNCDYSSAASVDDDFTISVGAGKIYYVFVDSWSNTQGAYTLTMTLN
jgi:cysteine-rich repeat protein